jgi:hypothetical protein
MKGAKQLDGKRVRLLVPITTKSGEKFDVGTLGTFCKEGVVRCSFEADDGRTVLVSHRSLLDFEIVDESFRPSRVGEVGFGGMTTYHCPKHGDVIACACRPI